MDVKRRERTIRYFYWRCNVILDKEQNITCGFCRPDKRKVLVIHATDTKGTANTKVRRTGSSVDPETRNPFQRKADR